MNNLKKTALASALVAALGVSATASADIIEISFTGQFALGDSAGVLQANPDSNDPAAIPDVGSQRTPVSGTAIFDTAAGVGSAAINAFSFFGALLSMETVSFQAIGDGLGGNGSLVAGTMSFSWNYGGASFPVTAVFDAAGFFANVPAPGANVVIGTGCAGCATSSTADAGLGSPAVIGAVPMAMTNYNTAGTTMGSLFPLTDDGISGSPMTTPPFEGFNANFDFTSINATNVSEVPVPAAVWLFGSGLMGLVGVARRRRRS